MPLLLAMSAHASPNHRARPADAACRAVVPRLSSVVQCRPFRSLPSVPWPSRPPRRTLAGRRCPKQSGSASRCGTLRQQAEPRGICALRFARRTSPSASLRAHFSVSQRPAPSTQWERPSHARRATSVRAPARPNINRLSLRCRALAS